MTSLTKSDTTDQNSESECRLSPNTPQYLTILTLIYYGISTSICCSIRYGFLADSFSNRGISGKVYGAVEGSMFLGFLLIYMCRGVERLMERVNSRYLLAGVTGGFATTALATGLVFLIDNNLALIVLSTALRISQGSLSYACSLIAVDFINAQLSSQFDLVNGLLSMGFFSGCGLAEVLGCVLYDTFGYIVPFVFASSTAVLATFLIMFIIPQSTTFLASRDHSMLEAASDLKSPRLTRAIFIPLVATALINVNYGAVQVIVTPFLHDEFGKTISYGGFVLVNVSVGMTIGSVAAGMLLQRKTLDPTIIMACGALCVCFGIIATFPPPQIPVLYELAPILAFPGVLIASIGEPLVAIASLRVLYDLQLLRTGVLTPQSVTKLTGIWLIGYSGLYYSGSAVAGFLLDYLPYTSISNIFVSLCMVAFIFCVVLIIMPKTKGRTEEDEAMPLIS